MRYLEGVSLAALARGNRRMLAPLKARHADAKAEHAETLAAWKERRAKALEIKDPEQRAAAVEALKGERPTSPLLVATGCTVVAAVVVWPMLHGHHAAILAGGLTLWVLAALVLGNTNQHAEPAKATTPKQDGHPEATEATDGPEAVDEQTEFLTLLHRLMPGTEPGKNDRIHLVQIAHEWADDGADTAPIRALLADLGIPITDCRVPGRGPSKGIYLRDVPPLPGHSREPRPGVVAGPDQQQQQQQRSAAAVQKGFWTKADPDQSNHSIIEWENAS
ncbi:hypothetical protein [Kitasatospora cathayae]|uniref:DUF2207 domain-containing protein n=1 Tax=Kitasatospora cathayae TaxID=3004092 RepID=A0ABY7QA14_9ACTN|nr:hypothetical protein [Kitasatospora sp. HUAS 3-15]WBP89517.1 hypothetical protein O1G21_29200 [Kitasatospora sp. HUAS 3-15]